MGVPKFYRWISERYPCLSEVVKEYQVPEFDNLYLDMNGIIHTCSHPNDDDPHFRITEEQIFQDIFHYIEVLFRIIRPRKNFFMAVDGVAPRAKMNQQRGRRFRSAKEAEENIKQALLKGETLPTEKRFDSNCITPGTKFMEKLQTQLEYFVKTKVTYDQTWQGVNVYLSGHQTPGEGEHKIMEFIRHERSQPGYNSNTRHCLYGLDADLMMLALCSHEPHFALLREEVKFTRRKSDNRTAKAEETTFHLLHISLMREYIEHEFQAVKETLPFPFDLESVIDDWVLMGFLVGNDFIPHLPDLHISTNALPLLYQTYIEVLPTLDGYLNEKGLINLKRFQVYLRAISAFDVEHFKEVYEDYKWLESKGKTQKKLQPMVSDPPVHDIRMVPKAEEKSIEIVKALAIRQGTFNEDEDNDESDEVDGEDAMFYREFKLHKKAYYSEKFGVTPSEEQIQCIAFEYILGLQWICHYYYNGVQSWSWYYPYHYSPYMSDLIKVSEMKLKFKLNKPFLPFQQLLAVLPAASKDAIPEAYWYLMDEESSVIGDFYPTKFSTDLNGKKQEWEAVVLIPFIDETRLLEAMEPCTAKLSKGERARNQHGPCQMYFHDVNTLHYVKSTLPNIFPDIPLCSASRKNIPLHSWTKKNYDKFVKGLLSGCQLSVYYQGFPTLYHLPHKAFLKKQQVKVFQTNSRNENMILKIERATASTDSSSDKLIQYAAAAHPDETLEEIGQRLLGKSVYVNWPQLEEAKVVAVSDGITQFSLHEEVTGKRGSKHKLVRKELAAPEIETFAGDMHDIHEKCLNRRGIDVGEMDVLVYAQLLLGRKYVYGKKGEITLEKQWSTSTQHFAIQMVLKDISVKGPTFEKLQSLSELFPKDADVFKLSVPHYGCMGKVVRAENGNAVVDFNIAKEINLQQALRNKNHQSAYYPGYKAAALSGISPYLLSRITGTIFLYFPGQKKWNFGLSLKFTKESSGVAGFTKRKDNNWLYSSSLVDVVRQYSQKYPDVFKYLEKILSKGSEQQLNAADIFPTETSEKLQELTTWLKTLPSYNGRKVHESSNVLDPAIIASIDEIVCNFTTSGGAAEQRRLDVSPHLLYRPMTTQGSLIPDKNAQHRVLDRVINVRMGFTVPLGYRGTIIGIHTKGDSEQEIMFDVMFDEEFLGGLTLGGQCPQRRGYKLPSCAIINVSYGERLFNGRSDRPVAVVKPHHQQSQSSSRYAPSLDQFDSHPRFVQSPHSAFTPARKTSPHLSGDRTGHVTTLLQRGSVARIAQGGKPSLITNRRRELPPRGKQDNESSSVAEPALVPSVKTNESNQLKSTPSLTQAARSLPVVSKNVATSKEKVSSKASNVHKVCVSQSSTKVSSKSQPPVKKLAIKTLLSRQNVQGKISSQSELESRSEIEANKNTQLSNALKTTLKISPSSQTTSSSNVRATPDEKEQLNTLLSTLHFSSSHPPPPLFQPSPIPNKKFSLQAFLATNRPPPPPQFGPGSFYPPPQPQLMRPDYFQPRSAHSSGAPFGNVVFSPNLQQPVVTSSQKTANSSFLKEGTDKLCEILSIGSEDGKVKESLDYASNWSTAYMDEKVQNVNELNNKPENETSSRSDSECKSDDGADSEDEDTAENDEIGDRKSKSSVDELMKWCQSHKMYPPVYTYCDSEKILNMQGNEKLLTSTVQLWNGLRFHSNPQCTRDKAMEEAASLALNHLVNPVIPPMPVAQQTVPSYHMPSVHPSVVSRPSYIVQDMTAPRQAYRFTEDAQTIPPRPYVFPQAHANIPFAVPPPPAPIPGVHPALINNYMQMSPDGMMVYPPPPLHMLPLHSHPPQTYYPVSRPGVYTPPFIPRMQPHYNQSPPTSRYIPAAIVQPASSTGAIPAHHLSVNSNPFVPSQVEQPNIASVASPLHSSSSSTGVPTGSPNYVLMDSPPASVVATTPIKEAQPSVSRAKKPKAKLAISFSGPAKNTK